jgi:anti-sigma B factor antagonist
MIYSSEDRGGACIVKFDGDLSGNRDQELRRMFVELRRDEKSKVAADMSQVGYLDSAVLGTLVWGMKNLRETGGDFRMFGLQSFVLDVFQITRLDQAFRIFETEGEALASFAEGAGA